MRTPHWHHPLHPKTLRNTSNNISGSIVVLTLSTFTKCFVHILIKCTNLYEVAHAFYSFQPLKYAEDTVTENNKITNAGMSIK